MRSCHTMPPLKNKMKFIGDITDFIFQEDRPVKSDVILIPGNAWPQPAVHAAELYREGMAPLIIASGKYSKGSTGFPGPACDKGRYNGSYRTEADFLKDVLTLEGVPEHAIWLEREAEFTLENAQNIRRMLEEREYPVRRAIICCQAFHARRSRMYFEYVFRDREVEFLVCPAVTQGIDRVNWTQTQEGLDTVFGELKRCGEQFRWMLKKE